MAIMKAIENPRTGCVLSQKALRELRKARLENQTSFWAKFGVTQSRGSRFEMGTEIPPPVSILLNLYLNGVINDHDLVRAMAGDQSALLQAEDDKDVQDR